MCSELYFVSVFSIPCPVLREVDDVVNSILCLFSVCHALYLEKLVCSELYFVSVFSMPCPVLREVGV